MAYPSVSRIIEAIKSSSEKNYLSRLLQRIEADCVLDFCTRKIAKHHPETPLLTIHDSIVSTCENIYDLEGEFEDNLKQYFGLTPNLKVEHWSDRNNCAA